VSVPVRAATALLGASLLAGCQVAQPGALTIWNRIPDTLVVDPGSGITIEVPPCTEKVVVPFPYERYRLTMEDGRLLGWPTVDHDGVVVTVNGIWPAARFTELPACGATVPT
jgi:hypothetical protein